MPGTLQTSRRDETDRLGLVARFETANRPTGGGSCGLVSGSGSIDPAAVGYGLGYVTGIRSSISSALHSARAATRRRS